MGDVLWVDQGSYLASPKLSRDVYMENQPVFRFRNFCNVKKALGVGKGGIVNFDKVTDLDTQGGVLNETSTIPISKYTVTQGSGTVDEFGNSITSTKKYRTLSEIDVKDIINRSLRNDIAKTLDEAAAIEFHQTNYRYVGLTSTSGTFTTDGSATHSNTSAFNRYHVKQMVDKLVSLNVPTYDGQNYVGILSVNAMRGIFDDVEPLSAYVKDVKALPGEVGRYYDCRFVRASWGLGSVWRGKRYTNLVTTTARLGAQYLTSGAWGQSLSDEAFVFGSDTVMEIISLLEQIRSEEKDLGRQQILGWYALLGYQIIKSATTGHDVDNPSIIKWDSKG